MTVEEYRELIYFLRDIYPNCGRYRDRNVCNAWWKVVRHDDYPTLRAAAAEYAKTNRYPPDIYDLFFTASKGKADHPGGGTGKDKTWMRKYISRGNTAERSE